MNMKHTPELEELIAKVLADYQRPEDLMGNTGLLAQLTQRLIERVMDVELTSHLGHERHGTVTHPSGNTRNGRSKKTLKGEFGELPIEVPRDRQGTFEPLIVPKHQTHWHGFDDNILSLYARGLPVRDIQAHLLEMYRTEVSPSLARPRSIRSSKALQRPHAANTKKRGLPSIGGMILFKSVEVNRQRCNENATRDFESEFLGSKAT